MGRRTLAQVMHAQVRDPVILRDPIVARMFPEFALCETPEERDHAEKLVGANTARVGLPLVAAATTLFAWASFRPYARLFGSAPLLSPQWLLDCAIGLLVACTVGYAVMWASSERRRRRLRDYLLTRGHALCVDCGYDLRGVPVRTNDRTVCPECGHDIDERAKNILRTARHAPPAAAA